MTRAVHILAAVVCVLTFGAAAGAQEAAPAPKPPAADISGTFTAAFETGIGPAEYTYTFVLEGNTLTGTAVGTFGTSPITEGVVDGEAVFFVEMLDGQIRTEYTGKIVSADEIQFVRSVGEFAVEELVARRRPDPAPETE